jgi:hypothetical protein
MQAPRSALSVILPALALSACATAPEPPRKEAPRAEALVEERDITRSEESAGAPKSEAMGVPLGATFLLHAGEEAVVGRRGLTVRFVEVLMDSRCPTGVLCVWAGEVSVLVAVAGHGEKPQEITLTITPRDPEATTAPVFEHTVKLLRVHPYPQKDRKIDPQRYSASLVVNEISP